MSTPLLHVPKTMAPKYVARAGDKNGFRFLARFLGTETVQAVSIPSSDPEEPKELKPRAPLNHAASQFGSLEPKILATGSRKRKFGFLPDRPWYSPLRGNQGGQRREGTELSRCQPKNRKDAK